MTIVISSNLHIIKIVFCPPVTTCHLGFVMKVLRICCELLAIFLVQSSMNQILEKSNFIFNGEIFI